MRKASTLFRLVASGIAVGVLLGACSQPPGPPASPTAEAHGAGAAAIAAGPGAAGGAPGRSIPTTDDPDHLPPGSVFHNPDSGRNEVIVPDMDRTAVLIGDSQAEPADGWPRLGLAAAGYKVHFCGRSGTGFVVANGKTGNYLDALLRGDWKLPYGTPALVVIQGGGNDAARGATDEQIVDNAERLIDLLEDRYPEADFAMIGTLARGADHGGGRRSQVDALLGTVAASHEIPFVSVGDWLTKYNLTGNLADKVHMDGAGRRALGGLLGDRLLELELEATP